MIIREVPLDNAWYRAAGSWFIAFFGINCLLWPLLDYYKYDIGNLKWIALAMPLGSLIFGLIGKFVNEPNRVVVFVSIVGLFGIGPLFVATILPSFALVFLSLKVSEGSLLFVAAWLAVSFYWIIKSVNQLKERMRKSEFIEHEFCIEKSYISLKRSPKTDLDAEDSKIGGQKNSIGNKFFEKLLFLIPMAYPLQRLFSDTGGFPAVLLLLSIFTLPLSIYILGRMARGYYLWIYSVRKIERENDRYVVFAKS